ncbi:MAG: phage portal protein, partial [Desulfobacteraceae bacterium]|nr:phage portal protein [Desulfobacteraceae bacterium]
KLIKARCRDLARNNPYIKGSIRKICENVVRNGINPQAKVRDKKGQLQKELNKKLEGHWKKWRKKKYCDIAGHDSIGSIQKLVLRHIWTDGEILVHRVWDLNLLKQGKIPFRIEVLECDLLADHVNGDLKNGNVAKRGIEFDPATGRPVAYHFLPSYPGDYLFSNYKDVRVISARDIIHVFEKERASQTRGVSWFVSIVIEAFDLAEYQSFERIGAKVAAAFGVFIKTQFPEMMGQTPALAGSENPNNPNADLPSYIEPGRIQTLPIGTEIQLASHKRPGETYAPYVKQSLKGMSAGASMSYGAFANDRSDSSYSAERTSQLDERLSYQGQQTFLNEKLNGDLWEWVLEGIFLAGLEDLPGFSKDQERYFEVEWQNPGWQWVDPSKDSQAAERDLKNNVTTLKKLLAARGEDYEEIMEQRIRELEDLLKLEQIKARITELQEGNTANA